MGKRLTGRNPLAYLGVEPYSPPDQLQLDRSPTSTDASFNIGTIWINLTTNAVYMLTDLDGGVATWSVLGSGAVGLVKLLADNGGYAQEDPNTGSIIVIGGTNITTSGDNINTLTINIAANPEFDSIDLPDTTTGFATGVINYGGAPYIHNYGDVGPRTNIFVGNEAGNATTITGIGNSGFGTQSLTALTSGDNNTCYGSSSGIDITTGSDNVCIGVASGLAYITESNNVVISNGGTAADNGVIRIGDTQTSCFIQGIWNATTGTNQVVVVDAAGQLGTGPAGTATFDIINLPDTATSFAEGVINFGGTPWIHNYINGMLKTNVFVGKSAGNANAGLMGGDNVGVGSLALHAITTGNSNVAAGSNAGVLITTGGSNTILGSDGALNLTTGSSNICIGSVGGGVYTTESNNIALGHTGEVADANVMRLGHNEGGAGSIITTYIAGSSINFNDIANNNSAVTINIIKDRAGAAVQSGDGLGALFFQGRSSTTQVSSSAIVSTVTSAPAAGIVPSDIVFFTSGASGITQRMEISDTGGIIISIPDTGDAISATGNISTVDGDISVGNGSVLIESNSNDALSQQLAFQKDRANAIIVSGDYLGNMNFYGYDGVAQILSAGISARSTGTIGINRIPSTLEFYTHPDSTSSSELRMVIDDVGDVNIYNNDAASTAAGIFFNKSRSGGIITTGDFLGSLNFTGFDGTNYHEAAAINCETTGTIAAGRVAGKINFYTAADSVSAIVKRATIDETGILTINTPDGGAATPAFVVAGGTIQSVSTFGNTVGGTGIPVVVDNTGLLGTIVSSRRFKDNIEDMGEQSSPLMDLRPVTFTLKHDADMVKQWGLIAEEVAEVLPSIVGYDEGGKPKYVRYHDIPCMLLNELQKQQKIIADLLVRVQLLENSNSIH